MPPYDVEEPDPENPENSENPETTTTTTKKKKKGKSREVVLEELIREMNEHNDIVLLDVGLITVVHRLTRSRLSTTLTLERPTSTTSGWPKSTQATALSRGAHGSS